MKETKNRFSRTRCDYTRHNITTITASTGLQIHKISNTIRISTLYVCIIPCYFTFCIYILHFVF